MSISHDPATGHFWTGLTYNSAENGGQFTVTKTDSIEEINDQVAQLVEQGNAPRGCGFDPLPIASVSIRKRS